MKRLRGIEVKSSKFQIPSSREAPIVKLQSREQMLGSMASWEHEPLVDTMLLKDEAPERQRERHPFDLEERTALFGQNMNFQDPASSIPQSGSRVRGMATGSRGLRC